MLNDVIFGYHKKSSILTFLTPNPIRKQNYSHIYTVVVQLDFSQIILDNKIKNKIFFSFKCYGVHIGNLSGLANH